MESVFFNECKMDGRKEQADINFSQYNTPDSVQHDKCHLQWSLQNDSETAPSVQSLM